MSVETNALVYAHFNRTTFDSKASVEEYIEDRKEEAKFARERLLRLAYMTEPKKFCDEDSDPAFYVQREYDEAIEDLETAVIYQHLAELVLDGWDKSHHANGCALECPGGVDMEDLQRIDGDYVPVVNEAGECTDPDDYVARQLVEQFARPVAKDKE